MTSGAAPQVARRVFEALFAEDGVEADDELRAKLEAIGVDLRALEPAYPLSKLRETYDVVRAHVHPALPVEQGFREVGRSWVRGFKHTPVGWVFRAMAPIFGADRTLQTLPRYVTTVRSDLPMRMYPEGPNRYRMVCPDVEANPYFMAGCVDVLLEACGVRSYEVVAKPGRDAFELEISWTPQP